MKTWTNVWINIVCMLLGLVIASILLAFSCKGLLFSFAVIGVTWLIWSIVFPLGNPFDKNVVIVIQKNEEEKENEEDENEN
jgi:uncharacterized membrane-anchored protein YitT (DUF2179 family)